MTGAKTSSLAPDCSRRTCELTSSTVIARRWKAFDVADRPEIAHCLKRGIDAEEPLVVLKREIAAAARAAGQRHHGERRSRRSRTDAGQPARTTRAQTPRGRRTAWHLDAFAGSTRRLPAFGVARCARYRSPQIADLQRRRADAEKRLPSPRRPGDREREVGGGRRRPSRG